MKQILLVTALFLIHWSCQDLSSIAPPAELNLDERYGTFVDTTLLADKDTFIVDYRSNTFNSSKLSVGRFQQFEAGFLIKFYGLPSITERIDSVFIELTALSTLGEASSDLNIAVFAADQDWDDNANTLEEWHNYTPSNRLFEFPFTAEDSSKIKFAISDTAVFNNWRRLGNTNIGLFLKMATAEDAYIREIASFEYNLTADPPNYVPRLIYKSLKDSVYVSDTLRTGKNASIYDYNPEGTNLFGFAAEQKELLIASGIAAQTLIKFDGLKFLPKNAIIQSADLIIPIKNEDYFSPSAPNTLDNRNNAQQFYLRSVREANDNLTHFVIDSVFIINPRYLISLRDANNYISAANKEEEVKLGQNLLQDYINGTRPIEWFYLQYKNERLDLSVKRLSGLNEEPARLNIRYFKVEQTAF
jgi:hypothetical protein